MDGETILLTVAELQERGVLLVEDGNHGEYRPRPDEFVASGTAFIRAADMDSSRIHFGSCSRINEAALRRIRKGIGLPGDILLSHKGTVGKLARAPLDCEPFVCSPQTTFWRVLDPAVLDPRFLYFYMHSAGFAAQLDRVQGETDMAPYVSLTAQRRFVIPLPKVETQRQVAETLQYLDVKIELNRRMARTLQEMVRALFKSWFVDFDPVRAKNEVRDPAAVPADVADLFPDRFGDDGMPEGWIRAALSTLAEVTKGVSYKSEELQDGTGTALVTLKSFTRGGGYRSDGLKGFAGAYKPAQRIEPGTLVVAGTDVTQKAEVVGQPVLVEADPTYPTLVGSLDTFILRPKEPALTPALLQGLLIAQNFPQFASGYTTGTTVLHLSKRVFDDFEMGLPDRSSVGMFSRYFEPIFSRLENANKQSRSLANLRDTLLPRLISGELRIPHAEALVEEAA